MRAPHVVALAAAALLLAPLASAQGIGDVAAREKEKKKQAKTQGQAKPPKVYTESDLGEAAPSAPAPVTEPEAGAATAQGQAGKEGGASAGKAEKTEEEQKAEAQAAWRKKLDQARKDVATYQDAVDKTQLNLNDMSGGVYTPNRAALMADMDNYKQKLAAAQASVTALEEEGRRSGYR